MEPIKHCPICGSSKVVRTRQDVEFTFPAGKTSVPNLVFDQCAKCGERFFDHDASQQIDAHVASLKRSRSRRKSA